MRPKRINELNSSVSLIKKKLKTMKISGYNMEVDEMLVLVSEKIRPIIKMLVETPGNGEHFITKEDCDDLEKVSKIIADIAAALENIGFSTVTKMIPLNLNRYRENAIKEGYIYVDTILLLEILELNDTLESIKYDIDDFYRSIGKHSFVQTETDLASLASSEFINPNRIVFKLKKHPLKNISSIVLFKNDFVVMPSSTEIMPPNESKSQILDNNSSNIEKKSLKRSKSTGSIEHEEITQVTDVYGARKVLMKCIYDLNEVSNYLGIPKKDVSTICSRVEVDNTKKGSPYSNEQGAQEISNQNGCCCPECFAQDGQMNLKECQEDQVVICIKGCNDDQGDIQIVIRQCPDCKKAGEQSTEKPDSDNTNLELPPVSDLDDHSKRDQKSLPLPSELGNYTEKMSDAQFFGETDVKEVESTALHNKDSKGSPICSDEEDEEKRKEFEKLEPTYVQNRVSCSKINLFETVNLCLQTESGKELVISLTIAPKGNVSAPKKLSLRDIFSDSDYIQTDDTNESGVKDLKELDHTTIRSDQLSVIKSPEGSKQGSNAKKSPESYYVAERYIPLGRTKVCSSLDFDVTKAKSRIRDKGIQNKNNKIIVQLEKFGPDNLLRACRPAKCCRKAVLNEKMKKCLPYAPSLRSLPLDDADLDVINQSLQMSVQKVKNSTNLNKDFYSNQVNYVVNMIHTVTYDNTSKRSLKDICVKQKLGHYINLVNDFNTKCDTLYFGVEDKDQVHSEAVQDCVNIKEKGSNSQKYVKSKFQNYEDTPAISVKKNDLFFTKFTSQSSKAGQVYSHLNQISTQKKPVISRIPVYQGLRTSKLNSNEQKNACENIKEQFLMNEATMDFLVDPFLETNIFEKEIKIEPKNINNTVVKQSFHQYDALSELKNISRYSMASSVRRSKRKKEEFYLSRSKSAISLNNLKSLCKNKNIAYLPKTEIKEDRSKTFSSDKTDQSTVPSSSLLTKCDSSKIILNYFTKLLLKMIMKQVTKENTIKEFEFFIRPKIDASVETENLNLTEIYRKLSKKKTNINHHLSSLGIEISYHELTAKESQHCLMFENEQRFCVYNNLALQTSKVFADSKKCQTSSTLLAYLLNSNAQMENAIFSKKRIFKKTYNFEKNNCLPHSCDEIENFIVAFRSDQSFESNNSDKDLRPSHSYFSGQSSNSDQEETLSQSLLKLKETLEKYENVKSEIANKSFCDSNIDPIEYFVYQVCACNNKINKKPPSIMQKILSKTKGLFSSVDKDICRKYNNFLSSAAGQECHNCGCYISKCGSTVPKEDSNYSDLCKCPAENKKNKRSKNSKLKPAGNLPKKSTSSSSSLKSIKARIKKSLCEVLRSKNCNSSGGENKTVNTICVSQNTNLIVCDRKSTSTSTAKNSSSQKCACDKCSVFADDGTCCCSHCLGCLDKSFEAKPNNSHVGIATEETENIKENAKIVEPSILVIQNSESDNPKTVTESYNYLSLIPVNQIPDAEDNEELVAITKPETSKGNDIETINTNDADDSKTIENDRTAFFFLTPPPHLFQQFRVGGENPFGQYLSNFPSVGIFHMDNLENLPKD